MELQTYNGLQNQIFIERISLSGTILNNVPNSNLTYLVYHLIHVQ